MAMVSIRHMSVDVTLRVVKMLVAVGAFGHHVMVMVVMSIVVSMRMFVIQRRVFMLMVVRLGQMQGDTQQHQQATRSHAPAG